MVTTFLNTWSIRTDLKEGIHDHGKGMFSASIWSFVFAQCNRLFIYVLSCSCSVTGTMQHWWSKNLCFKVWHALPVPWLYQEDQRWAKRYQPFRRYANSPFLSTWLQKWISVFPLGSLHYIVQTDSNIFCSFTFIEREAKKKSLIPASPCYA